MKEKQHIHTVFMKVFFQELGLYSLTDIVRGGVYVVKNPMLCYIDTIDWDLIARQAPKGPDVKKQEIHFIEVTSNWLRLKNVLELVFVTLILGSSFSFVIF